MVFNMGSPLSNFTTSAGIFAEFPDPQAEPPAKIAFSKEEIA